jgi:hypothetical protein
MDRLGILCDLLSVEISILMAVFADIVAFRTNSFSRIKYGFRALFLVQKDSTLNHFVSRTVKIQLSIFTLFQIATKFTKRALLKINRLY